MRLLIIATFLLSALCQAQTTTVSQDGVAPVWDLRDTLNNLVANTQRYRQTIDHLNVNDWVSKGASETYVQQKQIVQTEIGHLNTVSGRLAAEPEKLSLALDALFRLQALETFTITLSEGATRYSEDPQVSATLSDLLNKNSDARFKLRQYVLDLSVTKEQEQSVAEKEAARCQESLNRNPLAPPPVVFRRPAAPAAERKSPSPKR